MYYCKLTGEQFQQTQKILLQVIYNIFYLLFNFILCSSYLYDLCQSFIIHVCEWKIESSLKVREEDDEIKNFD